MVEDATAVVVTAASFVVDVSSVGLFSGKLASGTTFFAGPRVGFAGVNGAS